MKGHIKVKVKHLLYELWDSPAIGLSIRFRLRGKAHKKAWVMKIPMRLSMLLLRFQRRTAT
jgi:hypothetical protein